MAVILLAAGAMLAPAGPAAGAQPPQPDGRCTVDRSRHLVVRTVPVVRHFRFRLGRDSYTTGRSGQVRVRGVVCADVEHALAAVDRVVAQRGRTQPLFDGWYGKETLGRRAGDGVVYATFRQQSLVRFVLVDLDGNPVARDQVGGIRVKGSTGALVDLPPDRDSLVLDSSRVVRFANGLVSKNILWSVQSVDMQGNNVVNRGEVRFRPLHHAAVRLPLRLYPLRLRVRDAILHLDVGRTVVITSPDGAVHRVRVGRQDETDAGRWGRGHYTLRASGGLVAVGFDQPVALSRPEDAELTVVSYVDVAIFGATGLGVAVGLVLLGRRVHGRSPRAVPRSSAAAEGQS